jgi:hypothetical protein
MGRLHSLQHDFIQAIFGEPPAGLPEAIRAGNLSAERRLAIYRNNVFANLREVLRAVYPVVERLVGEDFFAHAAHEFIRDYPSVSGDIEDYGEKFAAFLGCFPGVEMLLYLPDTARLEWAYHLVFHAADHSALPVQRLAGVPPERYGQLRFQLHPASALLASDYPVHRIWETNQPDYRGDETVDVSLGGAKLLLLRPCFEVEMRPLGAGEFAMLTGFAADHTVAEAYVAALEAEPAFDLNAFLAQHVTGGTVVDFYGA